MAYNPYPVPELVPGGPQPYHRQMRNPWFAWWQPVFGALIILVGWMLATVVAVSVPMAAGVDSQGVGWEMLLATNVSLAVLIPLSLVVAKRLHHEPSGLISSVRPGIRWRAMGQFAIAAVVVELVMFGVALLVPAGIVSETSGKAADALAIIVVVLLTSSLQAAGEEYFFRGYLMQAFGSVVRNPVFAVVATSLVFTLAHGVFPWDSLPLFFDRFAFGLVAGYLVIRTGGLEASIAVHAVNNVITFIFAAMTDRLEESLGITDAPWSLVAVDVAKFVLFGVVALWIFRRLGLRSTAPVPVAQLPPTGYYGGPPGQRLL